MPRKEWTDEQKAAFAEKMKASRATNTNTPTEEPTSSTPIVESTGQEQEIDTLKRQIEELKSLFLSSQQAPVQHTGVSMNSGGRVVGTQEKYSSDSTRYPNPSERLLDEAKLKRFAFRENYELKWSVIPTRYQTIDGIYISEPRFEVELRKLLLDEDGEKQVVKNAKGDLVTQAYIVGRLLFHEDPEACIAIAMEQGLPISDENSKEFLDEMRYIRVRDWVFEIMNPKKPTSTKEDKKEIVIGGQLVTMVETSSLEAKAVNSLI